MIPARVHLPIGDALSLHVQRVGSGRPVLLLHGLLGSGLNLGGLARHLAGDYQVLSLDMRNHGRSPHSVAMNYPLMVADVLKLLDDNGIGQCAVVGHSMGGKVAMGLALVRPARIAALTVVDICPIDYPVSRHDTIVADLLALPLAALNSREDADRLLTETIDDAGMRQFLLANLQRRGGEFTWRANLGAISRHLADIAAAPVAGVHSYRGPTLLLKGAQSDYVGDACTQAMAAQFPATQMKIIAGAGHWPHAEKPLIFNALVSRFLHQSYSPAQGTQQ
jgi:esterase